MSQNEGAFPVLASSDPIQNCSSPLPRSGTVGGAARQRKRSEVPIFWGAPITSTRLRISKRRPRPTVEFEAYPQAEFYFECSESLLNGAGSPGDFHEAKPYVCLTLIPVY